MKHHPNMVKKVVDYVKGNSVLDRGCVPASPTVCSGRVESKNYFCRHKHPVFPKLTPNYADSVDFADSAENLFNKNCS